MVIESLIAKVAENEGFKDYQTKYKSALEKGGNFLGDVIRVEISEKSGRKLHLIFKMAIRGEFIDKLFILENVYVLEGKVYSEILPKLISLQEGLEVEEGEKFTQAKLYPSPKADVLIFEDLGARGFNTMYERMKGLDMNHMKVLVRKFANFHALSFVMARRRRDVFEKIVDGITDGCNMIKMLVPSVKDYIKILINSVDDELKKAEMENFVEKIPEIVDEICEAEGDSPYLVVCHNDCWTNNFLFRVEENEPKDVAFVDYQLIAYNSPVWDLSQLIYTTTDKNFRISNKKYILEYYYSCLCERIGLFSHEPEEIYPKSVYEAHWKKFSFVGFIRSMTAFPFTLSEDSNMMSLEDYIKNRINNVEPVLSDKMRTRMMEVVEEFINETSLV